MNQSGWPYCSVSAALIFCPPCGRLWFVWFSSSRVKNMSVGVKTFDLSFSHRSPYFPDFLSPPISSYFLTVSFNAWFFTLEVFFKNKLSGKNGTIAELNFWHTKYQSGFRAILLFSCGFCLKLFPFNSFAELSLVRPIKPCKGNLSWLKPKRKDNFYWSVMFIAG